MGKYWLHDVVGPLSQALGNKLILLPDYEIRSRSTGGFDQIMGIVMHHDADAPTGADIDAVRYCYFNASDRPIGNFHVTRSGLVYFGAAGASNHAGKGGPVATSKGNVPLDQGNKYLIGIEASNNGVGEHWPDAELDSYMKLVTTLCKHYGFKPETDVFLHHTWCEPSCPGRKIDPAGPTPKYPKFGGLVGRNTWNVAEVRKQLRAFLQTSPTPPPVNWSDIGKTYTTPPGDPILKYGVVHANVPWLQAVLSSMNTVEDNKPIYNPAWVGADMVNGVSTKNGFGDATKAALVYWESWNSLTGDGIYDTVTANRMFQVRGK